MKNKNALPILYLSLIALAMGSLLFTTISSVRAELSVQSKEYQANMGTNYIGVSLQENVIQGEEKDKEWNTISYRNYDPDNDTWDPAKNAPKEQIFTNLELSAGKYHFDQFRVLNSGTVDEYVRVIVYKYWVKEPENATMKAATEDKDPSLDLNMIILDYNTNGSWIKDTTYSTKEKEIWYYTLPLPAAKEETEDSPAVEAGFTDALINGVKLSDDIKSKYTKTEETVVEKETVSGETITFTTITYDYEYNGKSFKVALEVDAVQSRHANNAIKSAWGRDVDAENGSLSLID